ncbi:DUF899 family protein [Actinosynnema sp. NPDC023587]|uniref:DUF899 family protein n=1 Tax=Actinosynnema sp. NPDC023587 TaxID=3154695 RepID=UPI0033DE2EAE
MTVIKSVTRQEWAAARRELYEREAELIRLRDEVSEQRRALPGVLVEDDATFDSEHGKRRLIDLFDGRRQLILYHYMVPVETGKFCTSCAFWIDNIGHLAHLRARDTSFAVDCPVPLAEGLAFKKRMGWEVPWVSSHGTTFYEDHFVDFDDGERIQPGVSVYIRDDEDRIHRTYSTLITGGEMLNSTYHYLDLTPLGRQEEGLGFKHDWVRYHDEYDA